jgi:hypothetical protein
MVKPEHNPREKLLSAGRSSTRNQNETLSTFSSLSLSLSLYLSLSHYVAEMKGKREGDM